MKKVIILALLLAVGFSTQAATIDRLWTSLFTSVPTGFGGEVDGDGAGWWVEIWNATDMAPTAGGTVASLGWITGFGYVENEFQFTATEADSVALRLWNNASVGSAGFYIDSVTQVLSDLDDVEVPGPNDLDVTFDFTGQSWQAVPEPATALLFGIGGMGAFILRRNKLKAKEEADA